MIRSFTLLFLTLWCFTNSIAQTHFPKNGAEDERSWNILFTNANIRTATMNVDNGSLLISNGKVVAVGKTVKAPSNARVIDLKGQYIYPSFIEMCGQVTKMKPTKNDHLPRHQRSPQLDRTTNGNRYWNEAVHPEYRGSEDLDPDQALVEAYLTGGVGMVVSSDRDGIIQGSAPLVMLSNGRLDEMVLASDATMSASFTKGRSSQDYPNSQMGSIALFRQAMADASWYATHDDIRNISLEAIVTHLKGPWVGLTTDWQEVLRMDHLMNEWNLDAIVLGNGDEYEAIDSITSLKSYLLIPLPGKNAQKKIPLALLNFRDLQRMVLQFYNAAMIDERTDKFGITTYGSDPKDFIGQVQKAVKYGLSEKSALEALTSRPAQKLGMSNKIGDLKPGMYANFFVSDSNIFSHKGRITVHWINGKNRLNVAIDQPRSYSYSVKLAEDTLNLTLTNSEGVWVGKATGDHNQTRIVMSGSRIDIFHPDFNLTGRMNDTGYIAGNGYYHEKEIQWDVAPKGSKSGNSDTTTFPKIQHRVAFAYSDPSKSSYIIRNATVWTSADKGILENTDVCVENGKITQIGQGIKGKNGIPEIDGTGMHLTPGLIDEHSHIAISKGVNEGTQAVTSEVRIGDVINALDVNIYRQASGGVTTSHLLHGSANPIGGQTALIKLRYGMTAEGLKFGNDHRFIKFALGENVKQSNWGDRQTVRFPQTRMGVEQTFVDGFTRALEYEKCRATGECAMDFELEALLEIIHSERFITCHSYRQDEINMLMHVADDFGFTVNTFTHILEGYKVADKMKAHGAGASTFADWWGYKFEVNDAIPWNAAILNEMGIVTAINSDDAEMGRRLNQEAAKTVKYGGVSEIDALKMVTINPAILLHIDDQVGSIEVGKDADLVLWNGHPLSNYSRVETTWIDGVIYFDRQLDLEARQRLTEERAELIRILTSAGVTTGKASAPTEKLYHCDSED